MTVNASAGYRKDYTGNGSTTLFPVPFYFLDASHLQVILTDLTTLTVSDLVLNSDYTVAGVGVSSGGSVTTATVYSSNYRLTILRNVPLEQQTHYVDGDPFPAGSHEEALDKLTMIVQQQAEVLNRAIVGAPGSMATYTLPAAQPGYALGWVSPTEIGNVPNNAVDMAVDLANTTDAAKGAGLVGYDSARTYGASTVGGVLNGIPSTIVIQSATAFTTSGTAPNFTLSPTTPITAYTSPQRFRVKWHASSGSPVTLNVSGLGAITVRHRNTKGQKQDVPVFANTESDIEFDGTDFVILNSLLARNSAPLDGFTASCTGASASISMAANRVSMRSVAGTFVDNGTTTGTLNTATTGADGLDTGSLAGSTWYHMFFIYNPSTGTTSTLCSLSDTAPTLPSGYTHFKRCGAFRTDGTANKYPLFMQWSGPYAEYRVGAGTNVTEHPQIASGALGTISGTSPSAWAAVAIGAFIPPTATHGKFQATSAEATATQVHVAPSNTNVHAYVVANNTAPNSVTRIPFTMLLLSTNIYVAEQVNGSVYALGWFDTV